MADQGSALNGTARPRSSGASGILALSVDALKLADLQMQLMVVDAREFWTTARLAIVCLGAGCAVLLAAIPVGLMGLAEYTRKLMLVPSELALVLVSAVTMLIAAGILYLSIRSLSRAAVPLQRSTTEFRENLQWLRALLHEESSSESGRPNSN